MHMDYAPGLVASGSGLEVKHRPANLDSNIISGNEDMLQEASQPSESSSSSSPVRIPYSHHHHPAPSERFTHHVLDVRPILRPHTRSRSVAESAWNPLTSEPSLPPSLTTTPDSPIARSVPLPSVDDIFISRPSSPWRATSELRDSEASFASPDDAEPVLRNRLLDMVRDEFGDLKLGNRPDDAASFNSTPGLELDGMSTRVSRSNTIRSRASTSRGISPQPTIVLSLDQEEETLHEGHRGAITSDSGVDGGAQGSFQDSDNPSNEVAAGQEDSPEVLEDADDHQTFRTDQRDILSLAGLRAIALPGNWPRVALVSSDKLIIDRRVSVSALLTAGEDFGGLVPLDIPSFELGDSVVDPINTGSLGSSVGSSSSSLCRLGRDRKGSNETATTAVSSASSGQACVQQLFGSDFAARLICSLYYASLLKSPISSPLNSPATSPSTGTATAWWGGGISVRSAAREVLRGDWDEYATNASFQCPDAHNTVDLSSSEAPANGLGFAPGESGQGQYIDLPDHSDNESNSSTPIAASGAHNKPTVTLTGFSLEGKQFEFEPAFTARELESLGQELDELMSRATTAYRLAYGYASPGTTDFSGGFALEGLAAEIGPLAPELATTRPSTPPDTPTLGSQPLPIMTAPVTPMHTRPSSPGLFQKAVAINAALQQLTRGDGSRCPSPLSPLSISVTNEKPSRLEEMKRQSLKVAGLVSPTTDSPHGSKSRRRSLEWAKMTTPRSSGDYAREIFGLGRDAVSVSQPSSPDFLKRKLAGGGGGVSELDLSTIESAPGSPRSSRRNTLSGLGLFLTRAGRGKK